MLKRFLTLSLLTLASLAAAAERPNFVFFLADDVSAEDIGCYGNAALKTPNIDRLAAAGLRFTNAYLTISSCSPSRCSMITGRYPHNTGAPELHTSLPPGSVLYPKFLKDAGYFTVLSGKHHMGKVANAAFSKITKGGGPGSEEDWVQNLKTRPKGQPFFFWYASTDAHRAWTGASKNLRHYKPEEVTVPPYLVDGPKTRADLCGYYHEVSRFDHFVGLVVAELKSQGVLENTVIIVTADNGRPFPRAKTRLYDSGVKPPFVVHAPQTAARGVTSSLVSSIDISATVLELAGLPVDQRIQGVSFAPILADSAAVVREVVFAEHNWHVYSNHERMVRFGDWLYIRNNMPDQQNLCLEALNPDSGKELVAAHRAGTLTPAQLNIFWNPCPEEELYRVSTDPDQLRNLASNPENQPLLGRMRAALSDWKEQTGDSIPSKPTPDRDARPGAPRKDRKSFKRGEMPGDATNATSINHPGPIRLR